ncbi:V-set and immunoglobulin domain-containing protein 8-like [Sphaerodactylus townsendi]|uniref:V-set and immunoglobulin domain-containing protein 8-like n=1 Tax=Sphaerodactylus townsendi TaxID=933632 RepID=UPI0020260AAF|nr:V-set and immunoglobulin domain-containing protein 8-like [Sphaerodactylus townsendi]
MKKALALVEDSQTIFSGKKKCVYFQLESKQKSVQTEREKLIYQLCSKGVDWGRRCFCLQAKDGSLRGIPAAISLHLYSDIHLPVMTHKRILRFLLLCIISGLSSAVRITEDGSKIIYLPKGESVKLGCPFSTDPEDNTPDSAWNIQWRQVKPGQYPQTNPLLSYHDHQIIRPGPPDLQQRVGFTSADPSLYDASMQLRDVRITDSATYECTVKKTTEATHKVTIAVQERPAIPQCWIIGDMDYGNDITLRCMASAGSPPLTYRWSMTHGPGFRDWIPGNMGSVPGDLHIYDLGDEHVGTYQCSVGNNVGVAYCSVDIVMGGGLGSPWMIGGSVLCSLLGMALIIGGIIWCTWCCWGKGCCGSGVGCYCGDNYCCDCCCSTVNGGQEDPPEFQETKGNDIWEGVPLADFSSSIEKIWWTQSFEQRCNLYSYPLPIAGVGGATPDAI